MGSDWRFHQNDPENTCSWVVSAYAGPVEEYFRIGCINKLKLDVEMYFEYDYNGRKVEAKGGNGMPIVLDKNRKQPIYMQIYEQMKSQIYSGELKYNELLLPERKLALELHVNRTTILNAYNKLKQDSLIESKIGQGTRVAFQGKDKTEILEPEWNQFFNSRLSELNSRMIGKLMPLLGKTDMISFALGMAEPELIPDLHFEKLVNKTGKAVNKNLLSQTPVAGSDELRSSICAFLKRKKVPCSIEQIMILTGSQQGIDLCARVLIQPGDIVVVESPSYFLAFNSFRSAGAQLMEVPVDESGMQMDRLEQILKRYHPKFIYTVPTCQNPSSYTMSSGRRKKLLELAYRYNVLILEDDAYANLSYGTEDLPSLYQMDTSGYVIYLGTFSKTICSGIRLGFMLAHKRLIAQCCMLRQNVDIHPNNISQYLVKEFIQSGEYEKHLKYINRIYEKRRDIMHHALSRHAPKEVLWTKPQGGYYFWCKLPQQINASELFARCIKQGVVFMPGIPFFAEGNGEHSMRLNFTTSNQEEIEEGIAVICTNIRKLMEKCKTAEDIDPGSYMPVY